MHRNAPTTKTSPARSHVATALIAALIANTALATGPLFVRMADVGPVSAAFWRLIIATPILFAVATAMGERPIALARGRWWILGIAGVVFALDLASWHVGIVRTTLANSTLFGNSASLIFPIYGFVVARAWPSKSQGAALLLAAIGGALLLGRSAELSSRHLAGDLFCLAAGIFYALYFVLMARVRASLAPVPALALSSLATIPPLLVIALAMGEQIVPHLWWPLLALAIVSQLIGQGCMIYALGHLSPLVIGIALLVQPAVGAALGWIIFDERLATADLFGAALVAAALVLVRQGAVRPKG
ncbi:DMT family transporter [Sphingomonas sp. R1]|uniref:DMT family transporter n=1 Tax=Sphingomonas sp. R1 TaxID=399176 RepID=UPI002224730C|nr:DMT family transporter [Sphingomonas sp. R1]UYY76220.1 DMT family transporter [Sphingomonas sp. R1]